MEEAHFLTKYGSKVYIIHRRDELRASKIMQASAAEWPVLGCGLAGCVASNMRLGCRQAKVEGSWQTVSHPLSCTCRPAKAGSEAAPQTETLRNRACPTSLPTYPQLGLHSPPAEAGP